MIDFLFGFVFAALVIFRVIFAEINNIDSNLVLIKFFVGMVTAYVIVVVFKLLVK